MGVDSLPKTVTRQRRGCHLNPGFSAPETSTLTTWLSSHPHFVHIRPKITAVTQYHSDSQKVTAHAKNHGVHGDHDSMFFLQPYNYHASLKRNIQFH